MWDNFGLYCSCSPKLPCIHDGFYCNVNEKDQPWKGLFKPQKINSHVENSNHKKISSTCNNNNMYRISIEKYTIYYLDLLIGSILNLLWNKAIIFKMCFANLSRNFNKFRLLENKMKLKMLEFRNLMPFFIFAYWNCKTKILWNTISLNLQN